MGTSAENERWTDNRSWNYLYPRFNDPSAFVTSAALKAPDVRLAENPSDLITILAAVEPDGTGSIMQCNRWRGTLPDAEPDAGQYSLSILDGAGNALAFQRFDVAPAGAPTPARHTSTNLTLPFPAGAARIVLSRAGTAIASRTVSPNPPLVQLASPSGAGPLDGTVRIEWSASDLDGDALTYSLFYSTDDGTTWMPIATQLTATSFDWDSTTAPGTKTGRLRVVASDGVNDGSSTSRLSFTVVPKAPGITITSPADGSTLDLSVPVILQASLFDPQDGEMTSGQVNWTSNRDGALGTGFAVVNPPLSPGVHVITATSTNGSGQAASASITITMPVNPIAPAIDSITPSSAAPGATVTILGSNFDEDAAYDTVLAGGKQAEVTAATASSLTVILPSGLANGPALVTVSANGMTSVPFSISISGGCTVPAKPTLISPSNNITTTTPTYKWNAVSTATWYYLWVNDSSNSTGKIQLWFTSQQAGCALGTGACSVTPAIPLASGSCQWWVQTWNDCGYGPWSDGMTFTVASAGPPGKATLNSPSGAINIASPTYTWNAVANSSWYQLWVSDNIRSPRIQQWFTAAQAGCPSGTGTCFVTPATALAAGSYQWWIQTWNDSGYGTWSDGMGFTILQGTAPD